MPDQQRHKPIDRNLFVTNFYGDDLNNNCLLNNSIYIIVLPVEYREMGCGGKLR
jgi:hypothetical protein